MPSIKKDHSAIRAQLTQLRSEIDASLALIAAKHGLSGLALQRATFDPDAGNFTFQLAGQFAGGLDKDQSRYDAHVGLFELPARDTLFVDGAGIQHRVHGLSKTGSKLLCQRLVDSKMYQFDRLRLVAQLRRQHPEAFKDSPGRDFANAEVPAPGRTS